MSPMLKTVLEEAVREFGSSVNAIMSHTRRSAADAAVRSVAVHVYRQLDNSGETLTTTGLVFGRDRTTIRHSLKRARLWIDSDPAFAARVERCLQRAGRANRRAR